jgi:3D-(3,5/4)-trihydroxycyclohexane-1,2-dione acylhydrolase (decyclizing)
MAEGMGAKAFRPTTTADFAKVLDDTRDEKGPVVIVVPTIPHANLPASEVWWDVAPAEVHENSPWIQATADDYNAGLKTQRLHY